MTTAVAIKNRLALVARPFDGLAVFERQRLADARGFLSRIFCAEEVAAASGTPFAVAQANHSMTARRGSVRGLHYQRPPNAERKFVSCLRGAVFDVVVDLRRGSPTFLRWHGEVLSRENGRALLVPEGCAHGFQTLEDDTELLYLHTRAYAAEAEGGLGALDPALAIAWPLPFADVSERDRGHPFLKPVFAGLDVSATA